VFIALKTLPINGTSAIVALEVKTGK